jgi:Ca2+/Na+ antiporter
MLTYYAASIALVMLQALAPSTGPVRVEDIHLPAPCTEPPSIPWHLSVGMAIGLLALLGVIFPIIREKIGKIEKVVWIVLFTGCLVFEVYSIRMEDLKNKSEQDLASCQEHNSFQKIASQVDSVLKTTQSVASLAEENLKDLTGGDSYAYLDPRITSTAMYEKYILHAALKPEDNLSFNLRVQNEGDQSLSGVTVTVSHVIKDATLKEPNLITDQGIMKPVYIGTIGPRVALDFPGYLGPQVGPNGIAEYLVHISAQNGQSEEMLSFRKAKDGKNWAYKLNVKRIFRKGNTLRAKTVKIIDWTEPPS